MQVNLPAAAERVPSPIIDAILDGSMNLTDAGRAAGLHRNALLLRLAKMVASGDAPEDLLRIDSVRRHHSRVHQATHPAPFAASDDPSPSDEHAPALAYRTSVSEMSRLRASDREKTARIRSLEDELARASGAAELLSALGGADINPPAWLSAPRRRLSRKEPAVAFFMFADDHYGERVRPSEAAGYAYDPEMFLVKYRPLSHPYCLQKTYSMVSS